MRDENCIFCKLANGDIPTNTVYKDEYVRAIMDAAPANKGHVIILPSEHSADIFSLDDKYVERAFSVAKKIGAALKKLTGCDGINILQNNGAAAGQTVFHFHVHVIPRYKNDRCNIGWEHESYADGEAADLAEKIAGLI